MNPWRYSRGHTITTDIIGRYAGIGFKATAVVSECTYISSNGYEFCFDMRPGAYPVEALGLVCPRWEEDLTATMESWIDERTAGTNVVSLEVWQMM